MCLMVNSPGSAQVQPKLATFIMHAHDSRLTRIGVRACVAGPCPSPGLGLPLDASTSSQGKSSFTADIRPDNLEFGKPRRQKYPRDRHPEAV